MPPSLGLVSREDSVEKSGEKCKDDKDLLQGRAGRKDVLPPEHIVCIQYPHVKTYFKSRAKEQTQLGYISRCRI
jgi:hypothetical protein